MHKKLNLKPIEVLDPKRHNRSTFTCGIEALDIFIQQKARRESPDLSLTFVLTCLEEASEILGFYSLSASKLAADDLPADLQKKIGKYACIPATLLGRLATATKYQRNKELRIGETLLIDAFFRTYQAARNVASFGLIVDILKTETSDPTGFYERYGFIKCAKTPNKMYMPMKTIADTLQEAGLIAG